MIRRLTRTILAAAVLGGCTKGGDRGANALTRGGGTAAATTVAATPAAMGEWEQLNYDSITVTPASLASLPLVDVQLIRGIIFGKHGRMFEDSTIQHWLSTRPWYHPDSSFTNARLTQRERENLDVVREAEAKKHPQIEPGDMRFYDNRVITTAMLGQHSAQDWEVLAAEVLANHGFVFGEADPEEPDDLQTYFNERYWYQPRPDFKATELSPIERQNRDTITIAAMRQNKRPLSPGVMNLFQSTPLSEQMLANVNLADLRLLRNEVYARHGRPFQTMWLGEHFRQEPWYTPRKDYSDADLSPVEKANIALIARREEQLHEALSTRLLNPGDVSGLRPDDARRLRNEIYARHGRRFRDPMLQRYFASFAWYKPNDAFREDQLNATEKMNAKLISRYEHGRFTEG